MLFFHYFSAFNRAIDQKTDIQWNDTVGQFTDGQKVNAAAAIGGNRSQINTAGCLGKNSVRYQFLPFFDRSRDLVVKHDHVGMMSNRSLELTFSFDLNFNAGHWSYALLGQIDCLANAACQCQVIVFLT